MRKKFQFTLAILLVLMILSCSDDNLQLAELSKNTKQQDISPQLTLSTDKSTVDIFNAITGEISGQSTLHRSKNGLTVNYHSTDLMPGHAYTLWWVIWNSPGDCATPNQCADSDFFNPAVNVDVLYGAGHVVGESGIGNFSARLKAGDLSKSIYELQGLPQPYGVQVGNTFAAEVHMVLRSHGPAVPGLVDDQINSYTGGCPDDGLFYGFPPFTEIPDEVGECGDFEFSIHSPVE